MKLIRLISRLALLSGIAVAAVAQQAPTIYRQGQPVSTIQQTPVPFRTQWRVAPSLPYDALCLFDVLSGDKFYRKWYADDYNRWWPMLTVEERAAFSEVKYHLKDQQGGIVAATLTLWFSAANPQTLDDLIAAAEHPVPMYTAMESSPYFDPGEGNRFDLARPAIITALRALERIGFPAYWHANVEPRIRARAAEVLPRLEQYDIVPEIERRLGHPLAENTVTIYLLEYSQPHGIRITGQRLLTHESYPWEYTLRNAIHELMHPPFDRDNAQVQAAEDKLGRGPLLGYVIAHHDVSYGYNNARGYAEEDSVQALEQLIEEKFGVAQPARPYWIEQDAGMHVLAVALYAAMKEDERRGPLPAYQEWFTANVNSGRFEGAVLRGWVDSVMGVGWIEGKWGRAAAALPVQVPRLQTSR